MRWWEHSKTKEFDLFALTGSGYAKTLGAQVHKHSRHHSHPSHLVEFLRPNFFLFHTAINKIVETAVS